MRELAISIRQPWAWLIVNGHKDVENRSWRTNHRGPVLIHAGKKPDKEGYHWVRENFPDVPMPHFLSMDRGGVVGMATIVDCVTESESRWFFGGYGWVMAEAFTLPFGPGPGQLGLFRWKPPTPPGHLTGAL